MAGPIQGRAAAVAIGKETTHGTAVSPTLGFRVTEVSGHIQEIDRVPRQTSQGPGLAYGGVPLVHADGAIRLPALSFTAPAHYNDNTLCLFYAAMGAVNTTGTGPHTFTLGSSLPSYSIKTIEGEDPAGTTDAVVAAGCMCSELVWTVTPNAQPSTVQTTWNCQKDAGDTTSSAPTLGALTDPTMYHQIGDAVWNSITIDSEIIRSMTLTIANGLAVDREGLGTQYRQEPTLSGERVVTVELDIERHAADALRASYASGASSSLTFTATSGSRTIAVTLHDARIMSVGRTVVIDGNNMQTVTFQGFDEGLTIVWTNGIAFADGS